MKMKRVLACALSAAMIVTFVSFGNMGVGMVHAAVDIENESVTVEEKVLKEIESEVLKANAKANSEQKPAAWDNDGEAGWAFDDENHWWHSRYQGNPVEGEVNSGLVSASNPIWIQTGFGEAKKIKKITYLSRDNGMGSINAYKFNMPMFSRANREMMIFMILQVRPEICRMLVLHRRLYLTKQ